MEKAEVLRLILLELEKEGLLNKFVNIVFNYKLKDGDYIYIQYKVANGNITLNIFDNNDVNQFNGYVFLDEDNSDYIKSEVVDNTSINFVYLKRCLKLYHDSRKQDNLVLFGVWLAGDNTIVSELFESDILKIFKKKEYS